MEDTEMDAHSVAQMFANMAAQWRSTGAKLEGLWIGYGQRIANARTKERAEELLAELDAVLKA